ncbi:MAG: DmsC/YnfH family molybdoenzyme membrane anchor subunit [Pseudomonadota bacterium]
MHPAISVIFFTVSSGAGFGLIFMIGLGVQLPESGLPAFLVSLLAGGLAVFGLISSTFHLGHPERAWRAFSQWQSSWLSREGVLAVATLAAFAIYALLWTFTGSRIAGLGYLISLLAAATVFATAMIYAQLKTVPNWHVWLTPAVYLAFSFVSGLILVGVLNVDSRILGIPVPWIVFFCLLGAWALKVAWWKRADQIGFSETGSDTGTATGLGSLGKVSLLERPHSGENYLTREMVHKIGRKHAMKLRVIAFISGCGIPMLLSAIAALSPAGALPMALAVLSLAIGLFTERWLFFAEAKHAVSLYY